MFIKGVMIEGFKSYRENTYVTFGPGLNVIVGHNGSGKSNLFSAIQFVLSPEFLNLSKQQRETMLHTSAVLRARNAFVEIIFNNEELRLPDCGKEARLRRTITSVKDTFTLNNRNIIKSQVVSLLRSAGMSKVNPYYIIKQGTINELAMASDEKRLELFNEVTGALIWQEKRPEVVQKLKETDETIAKLGDHIKETEGLLESLKEENEEYVKFTTLEAKKLALQHFLALRDRQRIEDKLKECRGKVEEKQYEEAVKQLQQLEKEEAQEHAEYSRLQCHVRSLHDEQSHFAADVDELISRCHKLELEIEDRDENLKKNPLDLVAAKEELNNINRDIVIQTKELKDRTLEFDNAVNDEYILNTELMLKEERRQQLFVKLSRTVEFKSKEDRDRAILKEKQTLEKLNIADRNQLSNLTEKRKQEEEEIKQLEENIEDFKMENKRITVLTTQGNQEKRTLELQLKALETERKKLWRQDRDVDQKHQMAKVEYEKTIGVLKSVVSRALIDGCESVREVLQEMRNEQSINDEHDQNNPLSVMRYHGQIADLFSCREEELHTAIDTVAGNRLFYHVVDTDVMASEILRRINSRKLPGTVNFYALNRLNKRQLRSPQVEFTELLIGRLDIKKNMEIAVEQVFANVLICKDLGIAQRVADTFAIDCVTFEGDLVRSNGPITGGYLSRNRLRIELFLELNKKRLVLDEEECKLSDIQQQTKRAEAQINQIQNDYLKADSDHNRYQVMLDNNSSRLNSSTTKLLALQREKESNANFCKRLISSIESTEAKLQALDQELVQDFSSELVPVEREEINSLNNEIRLLKNEFQAASDKRIELEQQKSVIDSKLNNYLLKKREDLLSLINGSNDDEPPIDSQLISEMRTDLVKLQKELTSSDKELDNLRLELATSLDELNTKKICWEHAKDQRQEQEKILNELRDSIEGCKQQISGYELQLTLILKLLAETPIADKTLQKFKNYSLKNLEREIVQVNEELKRYEKTVNQKANVEYVFYSEKYADLKKKFNSFTKDSEKTYEVVSILELEKDDALYHSFNAISNHFTEVFKQLVPRGRAILKWRYNQPANEPNGRDKGNKLDIARLTGISIHVSFSGSSKVRLMSYLSGGQKSLVSLALIFAILKLDRAPFYLLDEADSALDSVHRGSVAKLLSIFAEDSQIIATTFRPELLPHASNIIGCNWDNQSSHPAIVSLAEADDFVRRSSQSSSSQSSSDTSTLPLQL